MPLDPKQRHKLLMADHTGDAVWITAVIEHLMGADPEVTLDDIETALRDAAAHSYVIGCRGKFEVVIRMPAMLAAVAAAGLSPQTNRDMLGATVNSDPS